MTATERGMEMMRIPMGQLPPIALDHLKWLSSKIGMCMEVCLTVYTVYAQIVEKLPCDDELYIPHIDCIEWYKQHGFEYEGKINNLTTALT